MIRNTQTPGRTQALCKVDITLVKRSRKFIPIEDKGWGNGKRILFSRRNCMFSRTPYTQHWILNISFTITTLFSGTLFAATDIFFEVIKTGTVIKELRVTIFTMPHELYLLFKISIKLCHFFSPEWIHFHDISHIKFGEPSLSCHWQPVIGEGTVLLSCSAVSHIGPQENKIHNMFDLAPSRVLTLTGEDKGILLPWWILNSAKCLMFDLFRKIIIHL